MRIGRSWWSLAAGVAFLVTGPAMAQSEGAKAPAKGVPPGAPGPSQLRPAAGTATAAPVGGPGAGAANSGPAGEPGAAAGGPAAAEDSTATRKAPMNVGGYSWSDKPAPKARARRRPRGPSYVKSYPTGTPIATYPGFRVMPDGTTMIWLAVSESVAVREEQGPRRVVYTLEGARVEVRNNTNALYTTHFSSPVSSVQLVPTETGMRLVIELRQAVELEHRVVQGPQGVMVLRVEAPAPAGAPQSALPTGEASPVAAAPARPTATASGRGEARASVEGSASAKVDASASGSVRVGSADRKKKKKRR